MKRVTCFSILLFSAFVSDAQPKSLALTKGKYGDGPDTIAPKGLTKELSDDALLELVQKQTFRFFLARGTSC